MGDQRDSWQRQRPGHTHARKRHSLLPTFKTAHTLSLPFVRTETQKGKLKRSRKEVLKKKSVPAYNPRAAQVLPSGSSSPKRTPHTIHPIPSPSSPGSGRLPPARRNASISALFLYLHASNSSSLASPSTFTTFAGFPTTTLRSATSLVTTDPAPTVTPLPILTPGRMTQDPPSQQSVPMEMGLAASLPLVSTPREISRRRGRQ